jgi:signal transduction histidine kinase
MCRTNPSHSGSKTASIRVAREGDKIVVEVQDHGNGMSPEKLTEIQSQGSGVRISGMRERSRHFSGHLLVESNRRGTRLLATLLSKPFPPKEQVAARQGCEIA